MSCGKWLFKCPKEILVETGSGGGGGIQYALRYGFKKIYSVEIDKAKYDLCSKIFKLNKDVHLYCGDSIKVLPKILENINSKATFLLDAHVSDVKQLHGDMVCPIIEELRIILNHAKELKVKHSIFIDDLQYFNGKCEAFGKIKASDIKKEITKIDPSYVIQNRIKCIIIT
jgi:hypothetical protein